MADELQDKAVELDPQLDAESKARALTPALRRQAEESERKEEEEGEPSARSAPDHAAEGVREHEEDMARRGFEKAGPPG